MSIINVSRGFALPTVLITSITMMIVLLASLTAVTSINSVIKDQYYNKLARNAAESGVAKAKECIKRAVANGNTMWTDPLRPNSSCSGSALQCDGDPACYVQVFNTNTTTFSIRTPTIDSSGRYLMQVVASVKLNRSNGTTIKEYTNTQPLSYQAKAIPTLASGAGWKNKVYSGHDGYLLTANGRIYGWGSNGGQQLSNSSRDVINTPIEIKPPDSFTYAKKLTASGQGASFICAIFQPSNPALNDGVFCRGGGLAQSDDDGGGSQLQSEITESSGWTRFGSKNANIKSNKDYNPIEVGINGYGRDGVCILTKVTGVDGGRIYCAGTNMSGMFGRGISNTDDVILDSPTLYGSDNMRFSHVYIQDRHVCATNVGSTRIYCAGDNYYGQLGRGNKNSSEEPNVDIVPIDGNPKILDFKTPYHSGGSRALYFLTDNGLYMTGSNVYNTDNGRTASGESTNSVPLKITNNVYSRMMVIGKDATLSSSLCVAQQIPKPSTNTGADLHCLGDNTYGQLGRNNSCSIDGSSNFSQVTEPSDLSLTNSSYSDTGYHMGSLTVIDGNGNAYSTGRNLLGKLGTNTDMGDICYSLYRRVSLPTGVKAIAVANSDEYTMYLLGSDGNVYASGRNTQGQLGNGENGSGPGNYDPQPSDSAESKNTNKPVRVKLPSEASLLF